MALVLFSCLVSGLLVVNSGQATRMQSAAETPSAGVAPLATEDEIPVYLARTEQVLRMGQFESVLGMSKKVLALQPGNVTARALLAAAYTGLGNQDLALIYIEQLGDSSKALEFAERAAVKFPKDAKSQDVPGWVLYKDNKFDRAVQQFESAIQVDPAQAAYHYHLGLAELQKGKKERAKKSFVEALDRVGKQGEQGFSAELNRRLKECE